MRRTRSTILVLAVAFVGLVSCDSGGSADPATIAPASSSPTDASTTASSSTTSSTTEPATTVVDTTTLAGSLPEGEIGLSPDGPWRLVDSAPGITTPGLVYELMPKLWVYLPVEEDIEQGILWTLTEEDLPIIEAYLQARLVFYRAITSRPMTFDGADWDRLYEDGGEALKRIFEPRGTAGQYADLGAGVVLRPTVGGDERSGDQALVLDCTLDGAVLRNSDGSLATGSTPETVESGVAASMALDGDQWKLDRIDDEVEGVCI